MPDLTQQLRKINGRITHRSERSLPVSLISHATDEEIDETFRWLNERCGAHGTPTIGLLLGMQEGDYWRLNNCKTTNTECWNGVRASYYRAVRPLHEAVEVIDGKASSWSGITHLPAVHSCVLRRPVERIRRLLEYIRQKSIYVAGIFLDEPLVTPERATEQSVHDSGEPPVEHVLEHAKAGRSGYLHSLGIQIFNSRLAECRGRGQKICVIDSGVDESMIALRGQVAYHTLIDCHGQGKESKYAIDKGCHGTKVAGIACARSVHGSDIGFPIIPEIQLGLACDAQVVAISALQGEWTNECGSLMQILAGMECAMHNALDNNWGGYDTVVCSMELSNPNFAPSVNKRIDDLLDFMWNRKLIPILAAGNNNIYDLRLGTKGIYVGAVDNQGELWHHSNTRYDILAPGVSLACCQPSVAQLGHTSIGVYSGTSLAAPFVAAAIAILRQATNASALDCLNALRDSANGGVFDLDSAYDVLM